MVVKLDLRIPGKELRNKSDTSFVQLLLFSFTALYIVTSVLIIFISIWRITSHSLKLTGLQNESRVLNNKISLMDKELSRLTTASSETEKKLDYLLDDTPTLEFMFYLLTSTPEGMSVNNVTLTNVELTITGKSYKEETVFTLINSLSSSGLLEKTDLPQIRFESDSIYTYKLTCKIKPILRLSNNSNNNLNQREMESSQ